MNRSWLGLLALLCVLATAGCTKGSDSKALKVADPACAKACYAAYDTNSHDCANHVDNELCARESLDKLQSCKKKCE